VRDVEILKRADDIPGFVVRSISGVFTVLLQTKSPYISTIRNHFLTNHKTGWT